MINYKIYYMDKANLDKFIEFYDLINYKPNESNKYIIKYIKNSLQSYFHLLPNDMKNIIIKSIFPDIYSNSNGYLNFSLYSIWIVFGEFDAFIVNNDDKYYLFVKNISDDLYTIWNTRSESKYDSLYSIISNNKIINIKKFIYQKFSEDISIIQNMYGLYDFQLNIYNSHIYMIFDKCKYIRFLYKK